MAEYQHQPHLDSIENNLIALVDSTSALRRGFTTIASSLAENQLLLQEILNLLPPLTNQEQSHEEPEDLLDSTEIHKIGAIVEAEVFDEMLERVNTVPPKIKPLRDASFVPEKVFAKSSDDVSGMASSEFSSLILEDKDDLEGKAVVYKVFNEMLKTNSDETWMFGDNDETEFIDNEDKYKNVYCDDSIGEDTPRATLIGFDPGGRYEDFSDFTLMNSNSLRILLYNFPIVDESLNSHYLHYSSEFMEILNGLERSFMSSILQNRQGLFLTHAFIQSKLFDPGISNVLPGVGDLEMLDMGIQIHCYVMKKGFEQDKCVVSALIDMYGKCRSTMEMSKVFDEMDEKDIGSCNALVTGLARNGCVDNTLELFDKFKRQRMDLNVVSWTSIIASCSQNGKDIEALELFREMQVEGVKPNSRTIPSLIPACGNIAALMHGKAAYCFSLKRGISYDVHWMFLLLLFTNCVEHVEQQVTSLILVDFEASYMLQPMSILVKLKLPHATFVMKQWLIPWVWRYSLAFSLEDKVVLKGGVML